MEQRSGFVFDPLKDSRWPEFLATHPSSSVFHTREWLTALQHTYGYKPVGITTCPATSPLTNAVVLCQIRSLLTGSRLVSLPFSDHCEPLANSQEEVDELLTLAAGMGSAGGTRLVEIRPRHSAPTGGGAFATTGEYLFHEVALCRDEAAMLLCFDKDSVRRKITKAAREGLTYSEGRTDELIGEFYRLHLDTRKRQRIPPQPIVWFRNLASSLQDHLKVRVAYHQGKPVASLVTLIHKQTMTYKYGCSDVRHRNLGGFQMLMWQAICEAISKGCEIFDLGRTDICDEGLVIFKERWGAKRSLLRYWTSPVGLDHPSETSWKKTLIQSVVPILPRPLLAMCGDILYRHIG